MKSLKKNVNLSVQSTAHNRGLSVNLEKELYTFKHLLLSSSIHYQTLNIIHCDDESQYIYKELDSLFHYYNKMIDDILDKYFVNLPF